MSITRITIEDMKMIHTHPHPGEILKETVFEALKLSVTDAAERLAMSRVALSRVLNGKAGISPDLALRLEKAGVSTARFWVNLQANYDLWQAMQHAQPPVRPLQEAAG
jgi:addiction module HigA family antidote